MKNEASSSLQYRLKILNRSSQRLTTMAARRFLFRREFGASAAEFGVDEDRVVAEAAGAARRNGDSALASAFEGLSDPRPYRRINQRRVQMTDRFSLI